MKIKEDVSAPTNSMGTSSSSSGPIQTFDPLLQRNKMLSRIKNILRKKKKNG